jgi:hypothetical protein
LDGKLKPSSKLVVGVRRERGSPAVSKEPNTIDPVLLPALVPTSGALSKSPDEAFNKKEVL